MAARGRTGRDGRGAARGRAGLTMIEVIVALAILAGGLLTMLTMQISAMRGGRQGRDHTEAARIVQDQMEFLHRVDFTDPQVAPQAWTPLVAVAGAVTGGAGGGAQVAQVYSVQYRVQATADPNLRLIDVRATWVEPGAPAGAPPRRYAVSSLRHNDP
jgi:prepilin-type N-terminal cleavage/methylation domain-containing protein